MRKKYIFSRYIFPICILLMSRHLYAHNEAPMTYNIARLYAPSEIKVDFSSVAGAHEAKQELAEVVDFLKNYEKYQRFGAKFPKGILLVGEPGNGKTLLAKALAGEANCYFFSVSGAEFIEMYVGVGAARMRDLFAEARLYSPCIIFIDEIDTIARQRAGSHDIETIATLNQLLTEMDGFETDNAAPLIVVVAATNNPDILDKALLRRFDQKIEVPYPDAKIREEILKIHTKNIMLGLDVDLEALAKNTAGFSGSDLAQLINKAVRIALKNNETIIIMHDIEEAHKAMLQSFKNQDSRNQAMMFVPQQITYTFADVAGLEEAKEELQDIVDFLTNPEQYKRLGAKVPHGILLNGDPGNGKTLLAKAIAGEANCPFFAVNGSEFIEKYVGVGASRVRELFKQARSQSPCIIFIDEIDALGSQRASDNDGGNREHIQTLNQLLAEIDGFNSEESTIIIIGATNRPEVLDEALVRAGRFDKKVEVPYPDLTSREKILKLHVQSIKLDPSVDIMAIARATQGFSGADLASLVNDAARVASRKKSQTMVTTLDFDQARDEIMLGKERKAMMQTEHERKVTAFHEAGHALVRLLFPEYCDPLYKVTIVPRGRALGVTHSIPEREKYSQTKEEMFTLLMVCLGGRAAEELVFNIVGTGASNDFEKATEVARRMICLYGMSEELGLAVYKQRRGHYTYSQKTAERIDREIKKLLEQAYQEVTKLLTEHRGLLDKLGNNLFEKETLFAREIYELLGITPREDFQIS